MFYDLTTRSGALGGIVFLALVATIAVGAEDPAPQESGPDPIQAAVEQLLPLVEPLENREEPPTAEEMEQLRPLAEELAAALSNLPTEAEASREARQARKLLGRMAALDLVRRTVEIRSRAEALGSREEPPTDDEIDDLRRDVREFQARLLELETELGPARTPARDVRQAEEAVAIAKTVEVRADAEQKREVVDALDDDSAPPTRQDAEAVRSAAEELQTEIESVASQPGIQKADVEPEALRRARSILNRLLAGDVAYTVSDLLPQIERLEEMSEPPSVAELEGLGPQIAELRDKVETLEKSVKVDGPGELPPALVQGRDLLRRAALLDLARSVVDSRPIIEAAEAREEPLTPEEISRLLTIPPELRPKIRAARDPSRPETGDAEVAAHPVIVEARDLLKRVETLAPETTATAEESRDSPDTRPVARIFRFYGSLRARMLVDGDGVEFDGQTSRIGVRAEYEFENTPLGSFGTFARAEMGFNFLETTQRLLGGDPGSQEAKDDSLFFPRLLFLGLEVPTGRISFGKQWSSYYDVAVFTDQMPFLAGAGTGAFPAGTDGGVSGTGRADRALQYRQPVGRFNLTGQVQLRDLTANSNGFIDTFGASAVHEWREQIYFGAAFNVVLDGVVEPDSGKPKKDDRSVILGGRYTSEKLYAAGTVSIFNNHETDDEGRYFSGIGVELYTDYDLTERFTLRGALSYVRPDSAHPGDYEILTLTPGFNYRFMKRLVLVVLGRVDGSTLSDGSSRNAGLFTTSIFYNF
jgi:predicted porin